MTRFLMLLIAVLLPLETWGAEDFAMVGKAIVAVTKQHFDIHPPSTPFSIASVSGDRLDKYDPIDPTLERAIVTKLGTAAKYYVPLRDLRLPQDGERDPTDPQGETYRGIESAKTGERVFVFYISHIRYVDAQTLQVHYSSYNGPFAAGAGYYVVHLTKGGLQIKEGEGGRVF